jgi:hypothetical protein
MIPAQFGLGIGNQGWLDTPLDTTAPSATRHSACPSASRARLGLLPLRTTRCPAGSPRRPSPNLDLSPSHVVSPRSRTPELSLVSEPGERMVLSSACSEPPRKHQWHAPDRAATWLARPRAVSPRRFRLASCHVSIAVAFLDAGTQDSPRSAASRRHRPLRGQGSEAATGPSSRDLARLVERGVCARRGRRASQSRCGSASRAALPQAQPFPTRAHMCHGGCPRLHYRLVQPAASCVRSRRRSCGPTSCLR